MNNKYLVVDDLAFELHEHPIYIPIPNNIKEEKQLNKFVMKVLKKLMKLDFYKWYHKINDVKIVNEGSTTTSAAILYDILRKISSNSEVSFDLKSENKLKKQ